MVVYLCDLASVADGLCDFEPMWLYIFCDFALLVVLAYVTV